MRQPGFCLLVRYLFTRIMHVALSKTYFMGFPIVMASCDPHHRIAYICRHAKFLEDSDCLPFRHMQAAQVALRHNFDVMQVRYKGDSAKAASVYDGLIPLTAAGANLLSPDWLYTKFLNCHQNKKGQQTY